MHLKILHLYHDIMDLYGDTGNLRALCYRCQKRGIQTSIDTCSIGQTANFDSYNLILMGGGADKEQMILSKDLQEKKEGLKKALATNTFFLLICGGYQLFGEYYINAEGEKIEGLSLFPYRTERPKTKNRCIGNIYLDVCLDGQHFDVLGFENHSGQTYGNDECYFGKVILGHGNYYHSKVEGFYQNNVLGTYVHGPLLPKNPQLCDFIIQKALAKNYENVSLKKLEDSMEENTKKELLENLGQTRISLGSS